MSLLTIKNKIGVPSDWKMVPIGKALVSSQYGTSNGNSDTGVPVVGMKNLQDGKVDFNDLPLVSVDEAEKESLLLHDGDILLNRTNSYDLVGKVGFVEKAIEAVFASYLVRLKVNMTKSDPKFVAMWLTSFWADQMIKKIATRAVSQANVNPTEFKKFCLVPVPPLPEQKAIADLLSTWDEAIEKTERLIQAKEKRFKRLLNDLIHQGRSNHTWKSFNLSDLCSPVSRKNGENNTNVLTSSAQNGLVSQLEYYNKSVSAENVTGYVLLKKGEFAYNRSSAKGYPYGATKRLDRYEKGVLSTLYLCFALKPNAPCESDFLLHLFESGAANRELRAVCQEGARSHGLLNITKADFFGINLFLPAQDQQKKIQSALNTAQEEINLLKQLANKYKTQKRGLMQKMLTGEWRVMPEIIKNFEEAK